MDVTFDYYKRLEDPQFYLCNPDMTEISRILALNRSITLRFNDLSECTFEAPKYATDAFGNRIEFPYYDRIETKRLVKIDKIGWFQIVEATENEDGYNAYKSVRMESHQTILKDRGFYAEERVYKFYDPSDPTDSKYDASDDAQMPSIIGQLYQQLGIQIRIDSLDTTPEGGHDEWTITHIPAGLYYSESSDSNVCRTMKEAGTKYGYDFIVNDVSDAFEVIFDFDILNHTIAVRTVEDITQKTNIYLSFENLVQNLAVTEKAEDIVTVLNCNGQDLNIVSVNPTGTNYIVDFSYYMDETDHKWMSQALINKLKQWKADVEEAKPGYKELVKDLMELYKVNTEISVRADTMSLRIADTETARDQYITDPEGTAGGFFVCGNIEVGKRSSDPHSIFYTRNFESSINVTAYKDPPAWKSNPPPEGQDPDPAEDGGYFEFSGDSVTTSYENAYQQGYYYFDSSSDGSTFGRLVGKAVVDPEDGSASYTVGSFDENAAYSNVSYWLNLYAGIYDGIKSELEANEASIKATSDEMSDISSTLNILKYFEKTPALFRELRYYWIEGEYENENLAVLESTTLDEELELAEELMEAGEKELSRVCQPRFSFTVGSVNFLSLFEFQEYSRELTLGRVITIEKNEGLWYYPALTEISFNLDDPNSFELTFSNAYKLSDWGFTYADLVTSAAETSRVVSSNWSERTSYSKDKEGITDLLYNPLDKTLRMAQSNMVNQDFVIDTTGILGRKRVDDAGKVFEDEQIRIINNVILFTDDGWKHAKTALGKIIYTDEDGDHTAYGLLAEVVVGSLMMSNTLKIINEDSSIILDDSGIIIKNEEGEAVFYAKTNGDVSIRGDIYATSLTLGSDVNIPSGNVGGLDGALDDLNNKIDNATSDLTNKINQAVDSLEGSIGDVNDKIDVEIDQVNGLVTEVTTDVGTLQDILDKLNGYIDNYVVGWIDPDTGDLGKIPDGLIDEETGELIGGQDITAFFVSKDGLLQASNAIIWGEIYASGGTIGGIRIRENAIESINGVFELAEDGKLICTNAEITGDIVANSLTLGSGVKIPAENIDGFDEKFEGYIAVDGTVGTTPSEGATGFVVSSDGLLQASNAVIYGSIYASSGVVGGLLIGSTDGDILATIDGTFSVSTRNGSSEVIASSLFCDKLTSTDGANCIELSYGNRNSATAYMTTGSIQSVSGGYNCPVEIRLKLDSTGEEVISYQNRTFIIRVRYRSQQTSYTQYKDTVVGIPPYLSSVNLDIFIESTTPISNVSAIFADTGSDEKPIIITTDPNALSIGVKGSLIPLGDSNHSYFGSESRPWAAGYFSELYISDGSSIPSKIRLPSCTEGRIAYSKNTGYTGHGSFLRFEYGIVSVEFIKCTTEINQDGIVDFSFDEGNGFISVLGGIASPIAPTDGDLSFENFNGVLSVTPIDGGVRVCCDSGKCEEGFCVLIFGK